MTETDSTDTHRKPSAGRILGMRPWLFWGAIGVIVLVLAVYVGARPARRTLGAVRRRQRANRIARSREQTAETPEGANSVAMSFNIKGNGLANKYRFQEAIACYRQALDVARKFNLRPRAQASLEMIGNAFDGLHMPDSAAIYYQKAQELAEADTDRRAVIVGYWNRGVSLIRNPETNDSAQSLIRRALALAEDARELTTSGKSPTTWA
jgi:tetratricopeptide (TPR) repeat protein